MIRPGNELLTDRHQAAARWLPTTAIEDCVDLYDFAMDQNASWAL